MLIDFFRAASPPPDEPVSLHRPIQPSDRRVMCVRFQSSSMILNRKPKLKRPCFKCQRLAGLANELQPCRVRRELSVTGVIIELTFGISFAQLDSFGRA